ncbi:MAG: GGDEF domain-containing protein [Pseudomonadota bacterium]
MDPLEDDAFGDAPAQIADPQALILLQIEDFADFETLFGDDTAAMVAQAVEDRLRSQVAAETGLWRAGHGCFAIGLPGADGTALRGYAKGLQASVAQAPLRTRRGDVAVTVAAGCAISGQSGRGMLGATARRALTEALAAGRSRLCTQATLREAELTDPIARVQHVAHAALSAGEIALYAQPIRRIDGHGQVAFYECLARLPSKSGPAIAATRFVPALQQSGRIVELDRLVLVRALDVLSDKRRARLSVNIDGRTLDDPGWMKLLTMRATLRPDLVERLIVEIPETAITADEMRAAQVLEQLRSIGVTLALDDFGKGEIGTRQLSRLRFDMVKLGGGFVRNLRTSDDTRTYLETLISMAGRFDTMVVAKSVEEKAQMQWLQAAGVEYGQGRYYGEPGALPDFAPQPVNPVVINSDRVSASRSASASR